MQTLSWLGRIFPRNASVDAVVTRAHLPASPDEVWQHMIFFEEVPGRPPALLRLFLPAPVRTEGEKTRVGALVKCTYDGGYLEKRITSASPGRSVGFEVLVQRLGIEDAISMSDGSYDIHPVEGGSEIALTTRYHGHLRPRWLFRLFERFLARRMHAHILGAMRVTLRPPQLAPVAAIPPVT